MPKRASRLRNSQADAALSRGPSPAILSRETILDKLKARVVDAKYKTIERNVQPEFEQ